MPPPLTTSRTIYELSKEAHDGLHFSPRYALETWVVGANMKVYDRMATDECV
jgi:hypothetical protein